MKYQEVFADVFREAEDDSSDTKVKLVHCIASDAAMGAGVALIVAYRYPRDVDKLRSENLEIGKCYTFKVTDNLDVANLVTKRASYEKPTYKNLYKSLVSLREITENDGTQQLVMPLIGCGLDRLSWAKVTKDIHEVFGDTDISITVCRIE